METIQTDRAPKAVGPYSQALRAGEFVYVSGQIALDPKTGEVAGPDIESQAKQALANVRAIVEAAGGSVSDIVKTTVYLTDLADFPKFNAVYESFFGSHRPARSTIQASALPKGVRLEIDAVAYSNSSVRGTP